MNRKKEKLIRQIELCARKKAGQFARELVHSPSEEKEEILAGLEFEKWLADTCIECLE